MILKKTVETAYTYFLQEIYKINPFKEKNPKRILFFRQGMIGDFIICLPSMIAIRDRYPNSQFIVCANPIVKSICPKGMEFIPIKADEVNLNVIINVLKKDPDYIVDFSSTTTSLIISTFGLVAGANRIDILSEITREKWIEKSKENIHWVDYHKKILEKYSIESNKIRPNIELEKEDIYWAKEFLNENKINGKFIVIFPGSSHPKCRWNWNNFATVVRYFNKKYQIVMVCSKGDLETCQKINKSVNINSPILVDFELRKLSAIFSLSELYVGMDSGITHLAAASKSPVLSIFTAGYAYTWYPYTPVGFAAFVPEYHLQNGIDQSAVNKGDEAFGVIDVNIIIQKCEELITTDKKALKEDKLVPFNGIAFHSKL